MVYFEKCIQGSFMFRVPPIQNRAVQRCMWGSVSSRILQTFNQS
jgi:hypothetical protein